MAPEVDPHATGNDLHQYIGAIVAAATALEVELAAAITSLSRSPLTSILVQGERGTTLIRMARRLLVNGLGSTSADEDSGRAAGLGLLPAVDTDEFKDALRHAERDLESRDEVVHSLWVAASVPDDTGSEIADPTWVAHRTTRARKSAKPWTSTELARLAQALRNDRHDIFRCSWNTSGAPMPKIPPRDGDVY